MLVRPSPRCCSSAPSAGWCSSSSSREPAARRAAAARVTGETLSHAMSVYLLLGLTWGLLYVVIFQLQPAGLQLRSVAAADRAGRVSRRFIYFSLTTLSTIGFGDITPSRCRRATLAVAEGITGQIYWPSWWRAGRPADEPVATDVTQRSVLIQDRRRVGHFGNGKPSTVAAQRVSDIGNAVRPGIHEGGAECEHSYALDTRVATAIGA